ncbi:general odorant-binding protein 56d-like [Anopheles bellator]|uniref:general odorant-binding protein 56d-like n=1 Tax=Anopheles bellator TaxID=139047 RepID=UPI00264A19D3|nr:general odorant-binding protein 56d-like [Anopheles bellator]
MNLFVLALTAAAALVLLAEINAFTLRQQKMVSIYALECMAETGIDVASITKLRDGDLGAANDRAAKCFMKCFFEKESFIDGEGFLQLENITAALEKDYERAKIEEMLVKCGVQKEDPCETAFHAYECYHDHYQNL